MQFLWRYIDDMVGKGLELSIIFELLFYKALTIVPFALPIAVLISSVMVYGGLSERYELSSFKSAGVSLNRILLPILVCSIMIAIFSFFCNNNFIPIANKKFSSRLHDIRKQKPALSLEEGIFNEDFRGFSIRIGKKNTEKNEIEDVLIYDHTNNSKGETFIISAERGKMFPSTDERYFVMNLYNGTQYQKLPDNKSNVYPFSRTKFKEWRKVFDLGEFEMNRTDEELFKNHYAMLSVSKLANEIDTLVNKKEETIKRIHIPFNGYFPKTPIKTNAPKNDSITDAMIKKLNDAGDTKLKKPKNKLRSFKKPDPVFQSRDIEISPDTRFYTLYPKKDRIKLFKTAHRATNNQKDRAFSIIKSNAALKTSIIKHKYELHYRFSISIVCLVFLFIGGPMGAIVRKGGFGYPLLVSVIFFTVFIMLNIFCKRLAEGATLYPVFAAWLPTIILAIVGTFLTKKAIDDSKVLDIGSYLAPIRRLFQKLKS